MLALIALVATFTLQPERQAPPAAPAATPASTANPDWAGTIAAAEKAVKDNKLSGASLLVIKGDQILLERYFGSYTKDTVIPIASSSKWLSGAVIMSLVDEGKLTLDTKAADIIPSFKTKDKGEITLRQLFSHTSGLPSDVTAAQRPMMSMEAAADKIAQAELAAKPGAEMRYGQASMQVAGRMAEVVGGKDWKDLFKERITDPLKMPNTQFGRLGLVSNPLVAGGARSSLHDYAQFLKMLAAGGTLNGKKVLSKEAVDAMLADQTREAKVARASVGRMMDYHGYGIGNWVDEKDTTGKSLCNSSPGAFGFYPWVDRSRGVVGIWMMEDHTTGMKKFELCRGLHGEINKALDKAFGPPNREPTKTDKPKAP